MIAERYSVRAKESKLDQNIVFAAVGSDPMSIDDLQEKVRDKLPYVRMMFAVHNLLAASKLRVDSAGRLSKPS